MKAAYWNQRAPAPDEVEELARQLDASRIWQGPPQRAAATLRAQAKRIEALEAGLRIIAGEAQCVDNLMGNADIARSLLSQGTTA